MSCRDERWVSTSRLAPPPRDTGRFARGRVLACPGRAPARDHRMWTRQSKCPRPRRPGWCTSQGLVSPEITMRRPRALGRGPRRAGPRARRAAVHRRPRWSFPKSGPSKRPARAPASRRSARGAGPPRGHNRSKGCGGRSGTPRTDVRRRDGPVACLDLDNLDGEPSVVGAEADDLGQKRGGRARAVEHERGRRARACRAYAKSR